MLTHAERSKYVELPKESSEHWSEKRERAQFGEIACKDAA
jgi:hypothetical protein